MNLISSIKDSLLMGSFLALTLMGCNLEPCAWYGDCVIPDSGVLHDSGPVFEPDAGSTAQRDPFIIEVDGADYGAFKVTATLTSSGASQLLVITGAKRDDPQIADDELSLVAFLLIDDLASKSAGEQILIEATTSFNRPKDSYVLHPDEVTSVGRNNHDSDVRRVFVRQTCFCSTQSWSDQTVLATLSLTSVSPRHIEGTIELTTMGGLPFYGFSLPSGTHTSRFSGDFDTRNTP